MEKTQVEVSGIIRHEYTNPMTIEVSKGQRGSYGWTIKVAGTSQESILSEIRIANLALQRDFPEPEVKHTKEE